MDENLITIKLSASMDGRETDLTVAEIGVLLTAINRSFNKIAYDGLHGTTGERWYDVMNQEPAFIQLKLHSASNGSLELQVLADALNTVGLDQASAKSVVLSILANAIFDREKARTIADDVCRGVKRVAQAAKGRALDVTISLANRTKRLRASVSQDANVQIGSINDDLQ